MRQLMMVRHLYTHNAGLVDKKYADQYRELTGDSLLLSENDQYEFGPLSQLDSFITDTENFFKELPW
jgi:hypothetical protein